MHYDEFGLFHENAEEFGLPWRGDPDGDVASRSTSAAGQRSAPSSGATATPELVLLHGGAQNAHTWDTVALALDRPLVALDLPGHGHSSHRDDHAYWPARERGCGRDCGARSSRPTRDVVVGMSLGGLTPIALTDRAPDLVRAARARRRHTGREPGEGESQIAQFIDGPEYFEIVRRDPRAHGRVQPDPLRVVAAARDHAQRGRGRRRPLAVALRPASAAAAAKATTAASSRGSRRCGTRSQRIQVPLTLARGALSPVVDDADVAELLRRRPDAQVVVFDGAGHSIQGDKPVELAAYLASTRRPGHDRVTRGLDVARRRRPSRVAPATRCMHGRRARGRAGRVPRRRPHRAASHAGRLRHSRRSATQVVRVEGNELVHERRGANAEHGSRPCGPRPSSSAFPSARRRRLHAGDGVDPDAPLAVDRRPRARSRSGSRSRDMRLAESADSHPEDRTEVRQLWPEHFDLATDLGDEAAGTRANLRRVTRRRHDRRAVPLRRSVGREPQDRTVRRSTPFGAAPARTRHSSPTRRPDPHGAVAFFDSAAR